MNLGENIYRLRTGKNMSQGDLAEALDVSRQSVSKWENNNAVPDLDRLIGMSQLFEVSLDQLVGREIPAPAREEVPVSVIPVCQPTSARRILSIILLCFGLASFLILTVLGGFLLGYLIGLPLAAVGIILLTSQANTLFKCCWTLFAILFPFVSVFGYNFVRFDVSNPITIAFVCILGALLLWTIIGIRKNTLSTGSKRVALGCIAFLLLATVIFSSVIVLRTNYADIHSYEESMEAIPLEPQ